jgi:hypothetical protein
MAAQQGLSHADTERILRRRIHMGDRARKAYGWKSDTHDWHPFNSIRSLRDHLWPQSGNPTFPAGLFQEPYNVWLDCYFYTYREASHSVHGSSHSLFRNMNTSTGQIEDLQQWDAIPLQIGLLLVKHSLEAFADAIGVLRVLNATVSART